MNISSYTEHLIVLQTRLEHNVFYTCKMYCAAVITDISGQLNRFYNLSDVDIKWIVLYLETFCVT